MMSADGDPHLKLPVSESKSAIAASKTGIRTNNCTKEVPVSIKFRITAPVSCHVPVKFMKYPDPVLLINFKKLPLRNNNESNIVKDR